MNNNIKNGQSASKLLNSIVEYEEGSTTILEGSTGFNAGKRWLYLSKIKFVIYKITCKTNNKFYIGSATWYLKRVDKHKWCLKNNNHPNKHLQSAYNKYGKDSFIFEIIEYCNNDTLIDREQYWINLTECYNPKKGFNISKLAKSKAGTKMPEKAKIKIGNFWRGKKYTEEACLKRKLQVTLNQGKSVKHLDKLGNIINVYPSISEASKALNLSISAISKQCSKNRDISKTKAKIILRYKDIV
jgi:hypothetical protein